MWTLVQNGCTEERKKPKISDKEVILKKYKTGRRSIDDADDESTEWC